MTAPTGGGCSTAEAAPVTVAHEGDVLTFVELGTGLHPQFVWPSGFAGRLIDGKAALFDNAGTLIGQEGGPAVMGITGGLSTDNLFHVCAIGSKRY
jgi:enoyl-CoA hydratase/carnithine racemase